MWVTPVASAKASWRMLLVTLVLPAHTSWLSTVSSVGPCVSAGDRGLMAPCPYACFLLIFFFFFEKEVECFNAVTNSGFINAKGDSLSLCSEFYKCSVRNGAMNIL